MRKTLLTALKHGSGTIFILLAMMLGVSLQAWGTDYTLYIYCPSAPDYIYFWDSGGAIGPAWPGTSWGEFSKTSLGNNWYKCTVSSTQSSYCFKVKKNNSESTNKCSLNNSWVKISDTDTEDYKAPSQYYLKSSFTDWDESDSGTSFDGFAESNGANYHQHVLSAGTYTYRVYKGGWYGPSVKNNRGDGTVSVTGGGGSNFSFTITGLDKIVTIYYDPGADESFVNAVDACTSPTVTTSSTPSDKDDESATLTGSYTTEDVCAAVSKGIAYKASGAADYTLEADGTSSSGDISVDLTGLSPLTTYYYKAYVEISGSRYVYGDEYSFTTDCQSGITVTGPSGTGEGPRCFGESFTALSVTASGASGYTYQWYYNTTNSTTEGSIAISGATSASYTPAVVGENYYYCAVGATGGYCEVNSEYSGKVKINATPTLSVSESSVTNYTPVTVTAKGANIATWSVDTPANNSDRYLYKKTASSAKFKAKVNASATYTITGTTANSCSNTATVTVTTDSQDCH